MITLATVGYGDIVPLSNLARMLAAFEVIVGVLLILFGVSESFSNMLAIAKSARLEIANDDWFYDPAVSGADPNETRPGARPGLDMLMRGPYQMNMCDEN